MTTLVVSLSTSSSFLFSKREGQKGRLGGGMCFPLRKGTPRTTLPRRHHHHHRNSRKRTTTSIPRAAFLRDFLKPSSSKNRKEEDRNIEIFEGEVNEILESARAAVFPTTAEKKTGSGDANKNELDELRTKVKDLENMQGLNLTMKAAFDSLLVQHKALEKSYNAEVHQPKVQPFSPDPLK